MHISQKLYLPLQLFRDMKNMYTYIETGAVTSQLTERIEERVKTIRSREDIEMGYWSMNAALQDERFFGEKKFSDLLNWLIAEGRKEDVERAIQDLDYRKKLYREKDGQNNLK